MKETIQFVKRCALVLSLYGIWNTATQGKDVLQIPPQTFLESTSAARYIRSCDAEGAGFFHIPGTKDTCFKIGGTIRAEYRAQTIGRFYIFKNWDPTAASSRMIDRVARDNHGFLGRARVNMDVRTPTPYGTLRAYIDYHLEHMTGVYVKFGQLGGGNSAQLRAAFIQYRGVSAGYTQSMFDFYANYYGYQSIRGSDQVVNLLSYTALFGGGVTATISAESNVHRRSDVYATRKANYDEEIKNIFRPRPERYPDLIGVVRIDQGWGAAQLSAALHSQHIVAAYPTPTDIFSANSSGYAFQAGLRLKLPKLAEGDDLWLQAAYAKGALNYQHVGSDYSSSYNRWIGIGEGEVVGYLDASGGLKLAKPDSWSAVAAFKHFWSPSLATILRGSFVSVLYPESVKNIVRTHKWNEARLSFTQEWYPIAGLTVGVEALYVRLHQQPPLVSGPAFVGVKGLAFRKLTEGIEARLRIERAF